MNGAFWFGASVRQRLVAVTAVLATVVTSVVLAATPASAGGKPYSPTSWAGYRAYNWRDNTGNSLNPHTVKAAWKVPCLPTTADGVYGAYDQWIGISDVDGVSFIQAGVRSYHIDFGWGVTTGYFAWILDTRDPNARTPQQAFPIYHCGLEDEAATVHAQVSANGNAWIYADNWGFSGEPRKWSPNYWGPAIANPGYGDFIFERFSQTQNLPWFGRAKFTEAWVGGDPNHGWSLGSPDEFVGKQPFYMNSLNPRPPWLPPSIAVATTGTGPTGNFDLHQWAVN